MRISVLDFSTPAEALAQAVDGDCVLFEGGVFAVPVGGWQIAKSLDIAGAGYATRLQSTDANTSVFTVAPSVPSVHIHDLRLERVGTGTGSGAGVLCRTTNASSGVIEDIRLSRLVIEGFAGHGVVCDGYNQSSARVARLTMLDCTARGCGGAGLYLRNAYGVYCAGLELSSNAGGGAAVQSGSIAMYQCTMNGNGDAGVRLDGCEMARVDGCRFGALDQATADKVGIVVGCSAIIGACYFESGSNSAPCIGILIAGSTGTVAVLPNRFKNMATAVTYEDGLGCCFMPQYIEAGTGAIDLTPVPDAAFGMRGGALLPSRYNAVPMFQVQDGMMIYNGSPLIYLAGEWRVLVTE